MSRPNSQQDGIRSGRNVFVENALRNALKRIEDFISGEQVKLPSASHRRACEDILAQSQTAEGGGRKRGSRRTAALFFMFYRLERPDWNLDELPVGTRGKYGDKLLSEQLTQRNITLHDAITAFAENLGWKGNVQDRNVHLMADNRFNGFLRAVADAGPAARKRIADYMAQQFAASRREIEPLPPVGPDVLTFARAKTLFHQVLGLASEGHIQQFLLAALLLVFRRHYGIEVKTHHPHAADKYDDTAGDIEEWRGQDLVRAYEVTFRDDWKNRISNFRNKMDRFSLHKYVIIARDIDVDQDWSVPARMALKLEPYGRDIAVIDVVDVVNFLAAELTPGELRDAVNQGYDYLCDRKLSGREDFKAAYREAVRGWLDTVGDTARDGDGTETEGEAG